MAAANKGQYVCKGDPTGNPISFRLPLDMDKVLRDIAHHNGVSPGDLTKTFVLKVLEGELPSRSDESKDESK